MPPGIAIGKKKPDMIFYLPVKNILIHELEAMLWLWQQSGSFTAGENSFVGVVRLRVKLIRKFGSAISLRDQLMHS